VTRFASHLAADAWHRSRRAGGLRVTAVAVTTALGVAVALPAAVEAPAATAPTGLPPDAAPAARGADLQYYLGAWHLIATLPLQQAPAARPLAQARFEVSFLGRFGRQRGSATSTVAILALDTAHRFAVVTRPGTGTAVVLARTPRLTPAQAAAARRALRHSGVLTA
jgi:lipocalin